MGLAVFLFLPFLFLALREPPQARAVSLFTPFGGKVVNHSFPESCLNEITIPIATATFGTVWLTIEALEVQESQFKKTTVGIPRLSGVVIPALTTIYEKGGYTGRGTQVLGNSVNVCDICGKASDIPAAKKICGAIPQSDKVFGIICEAVSADCPIANLVHQMGTNAPSLGPIQVPNLLDVLPGGGVIQFLKDLF